MNIQTQKNFVRHVEDFVCENCGKKVKGNGYTNHCSACLYSKHVDLNVPGDRENPCQGLMQPVEYEIKDGNYIIVHRCAKCGFVKKNKFDKDDCFETLLKIGNSN